MTLEEFLNQLFEIEQQNNTITITHTQLGLLRLLEDGSGFKIYPKNKEPFIVPYKSPNIDLYIIKIEDVINGKFYNINKWIKKGE